MYHPAETLAWTKATVTGTVPSPRRAHSATLIGTKLYIFGGGETGGKPVNDTFVLDVGPSPVDVCLR